ncbi:MAG: hypothetical protein ACRDUV_00585 [Pseudonocardiaceae bacterium]
MRATYPAQSFERLILAWGRCDSADSTPEWATFLAEAAGALA